MSNHQEPWNNQQRPLGQPFKYVSIFCIVYPHRFVLYTNIILFFFLVVNIPQYYHHQQRWSKVCLWNTFLILKEKRGTNQLLIGGQAFYPLPSLPSLGNGSGHHPHGFNIPSINPASDQIQMGQVCILKPAFGVI